LPVGATNSQSATPWPERLVAPVPSVSDFVAGGDHTAYYLTPLSDGYGPYQLHRIDLTTGVVTDGPAFSLPGISLASGYLWVFGTAPDVGPLTAPELCQVDPQTLQVVRPISHWPVSQPAPGSSSPNPVVGAPDGTVWVGIRGWLFHFDASTGAFLSSSEVTAGFVGDVVIDPSGRYLFLALSGVSLPQGEASVVEELDALTGRLLVSTSGDSVIAHGAVGFTGIVSAPGTVWASFRTGMDGVTVILRQSDLTQVNTPLPEGNDIYGWPMSTSVLYQGNSVWLTNGWGVWACLDPSTGAIRAAGKSEMGFAQLVTSSTSFHTLYVITAAGFVALTPPLSCWA
jgi:hypothetical protein